MPKLTPKTGTPVRAKRRSACRIEPSPPSTRQRSGGPRSPTTSMPSAAAPCFSSSSLVATSRQPASRATATAIATASVAAGGCEWVISAAVFTLAPPRAATDRAPRGPRPPARRRRTRRRSRDCPSGPAAPRRRSRAPAGRSRAAAWATVRIASRRSAASRTTPRPTRSRPSSNCGLTIARTSPPGRQAAGDRRQHLGQGDEGDVDGRQRWARRAGPPGTIARALRRSITVTRGSSRSRRSSWP